LEKHPKAEVALKAQLSKLEDERTNLNENIQEKAKMLQDLNFSKKKNAKETKICESSVEIINSKLQKFEETRENSKLIEDNNNEERIEIRHEISTRY